MNTAALLDLAAQLLRQVLRFEHPADALAAEFYRQHKALGARDRHALSDTVFRVLRQLPLLQHLAKSGNGAPERRLAILAWAGDEGRLQAALSGPERLWLQTARAVDRGALPEDLRHNLPDWLAAALRAQLDDAGFWSLIAALDLPAPLDLRVNTLKTKRDDVQAVLVAAGHAAEPSPFAPEGLRMAHKASLAGLAPYTDGQIEVQDEGSQLLVHLVGARRGEMVADFCAGAGGKTLGLGAAMRNTGRLYAFDISGHRLAALEPRLQRSGLSNVYRVQIAHERDERIRRLDGKLDRVLVDAPCSGLGTLRRQPDLKWRHTPASIQAMCARQLAILESAARLLKPGGRLVYATCSLLCSENEDVAATFQEAQRGNFVAVPALTALRAARVSQAEALVAGDCFRLWPHLHGSDGYFAAIWRRR